MKVTIEITCCDTDEMLNHISDIRKKVKKFLIQSEESGDNAAHYSHNNCDGHYAVPVDMGRWAGNELMKYFNKGAV